jgi:hypothetical protein
LVHGITAELSTFWRAKNIDGDWTTKADRSVQGGKVSTLLDTYAADSYPWWSLDHKGIFLGAHDAINDAAATMLGNLGCCISIANQSFSPDPHGNAVSWDSRPHPFPFDRHLIFIDCEGTAVKGITRSYGFVHLRSRDV